MIALLFATVTLFVPTIPNDPTPLTTRHWADVAQRVTCEPPPCPWIDAWEPTGEVESKGSPKCVARGEGWILCESIDWLSDGIQAWGRYLCLDTTLAGDDARFCEFEHGPVCVFGDWVPNGKKCFDRPFLPGVWVPMFERK